MLLDAFYFSFIVGSNKIMYYSYIHLISTLDFIADGQFPLLSFGVRTNALFKKVSQVQIEAFLEK